MGHLNSDIIARATTDLGMASPGARRYVYMQDRDVLVRIFSDEHLTDTMANPMTADEEGYFEDCYVQSGAYRVIIRSATGVELTTQSVIVESKVQPSEDEKTSHQPLPRRSFGTVADLLNDVGLSYDNATEEYLIAAEDRLIVEDGGFVYRVLPRGTHNQHLTTAGGVKLEVVPGQNGFANVHAFGATGINNTNQNAALQAAQDSKLPIFFPRGTYIFTTPLVLGAAWRGVRRARRAFGTDGVTLKFNGTGQAITTSDSFDDFTLDGNINVAGQSGLLVVNAAFAVSNHRLSFYDFDEVSLAYGVQGVVGNYFLDVNGIQIRNDNRQGAKAIYVAGLSLPNTNANLFQNIFVTGAFKRYFHIEGNNNTFINCDANPQNDDVAGGVDSAFDIEGHLNTFTNTYIEPLGNTAPTLFFRFGVNANSNKFERTYLASLKGSGNVNGMTEDLGTNNDIEIGAIGYNFPQTQGVNAGAGNLCPNSHFLSPDPVSGMPSGWLKMGDGAVSRDTNTVRGAKHSLRLSVTDQAVAAQVFLSSTTPGLHEIVSNQPANKFAEQTITAGVWCLSSIKGLGGIKLNAGGATVGSQFHTGSGKWEFIAVQARAESGTPNVSIQLRTDVDNLPRSGECFFSEPVVMLGGDVVRHSEPRSLTEAEAVLSGPLIQNRIITFTDGNSSPDISEGNIFRTANSAATTIENFSGNRESAGTQEIKIFVDDSNTTLGNSSNIRTLANSDRALVANSVCKLLWNGSKWIEF